MVLPRTLIVADRRRRDHGDLGRAAGGEGVAHAPGRRHARSRHRRVRHVEARLAWGLILLAIGIALTAAIGLSGTIAALGFGVALIFIGLSYSGR